MTDAKALQHLRKLLAAPGQQFPGLDLTAGTNAPEPPQSEVGRRRGARNTGPFPSAPSRTRRMSFPITGSPVITFRVIGSRMTLRTVSVSCITQPSPPDYRDHLCPFALIPAFPDFMAGRDSGDYHGHSSPWGSRPVGDPAVRLRCTYRARRRPPTHPLNPPRWRTPHVTEVARSHGFMTRHGMSSVTGIISDGCTLSSLGIRL